jgi:hypothetical protein
MAGIKAKSKTFHASMAEVGNVDLSDPPSPAGKEFS